MIQLAQMVSQFGQAGVGSVDEDEASVGIPQEDGRRHIVDDGFEMDLAVA